MTGEDWWRGAVIYQIYPRSFLDSNGDGIGDLPGIVDRLEYIARLGVDAIWIAPFFPSPMADFGYDIADYCGVDPSFGTLADFDRLLARAHALGLKVLIDQVWGHSSDRHPWFADSRSNRHASRADWYVWAEAKPDGSAPNNWLSVFGGPAWRWEPRRRQYYLHHFLVSQPKLNLRNPAVVEALADAGRFWLDRGVDGFRLDAVDFLLHDPELRDNPAKPPPDDRTPAKLFGLQRHVHDMSHPDIAGVLRRIRRLVDEYPGAMTLAELSGEADAFDRLERYTGGIEQLHTGYTLQPLRGPFDRATLLRLIQSLAVEDRQGWVTWSFSNHDVERAVSRWGPNRRDEDFARLLMGLMLSLRGSTCIYQGEELGLPEAAVRREDMRDPYGLTYYPEYRGRDGSRTPMPWRANCPHAGFSTGKPWLPVDPAHAPLAVDRQEADPASLLWSYRRFLALRRAHPSLISGTLHPVEAPDPLVAFRRVGEGESLLVVLNMAGESAVAPRRLLAEAALLQDHGFAGPSNTGGDLLLPRYGMLFAAEPHSRR